MTKTHIPLTTSKRVYSAPRKFDLSTTLVVTTAYAAVFGLMRSLSFPMIAVTMVASFFTLVALGQAILFGGRHARWASQLVGSAFFVTVVAFALTQSGVGASVNQLPILVFNAVFGAFCGYVGGVLVGFVFMIADAVRRIINPKTS